MSLKLNSQNQKFILIGLILISFATGLLIYSIAPKTIPIHWNSSGNADNFGQKSIALFLIPIIMTFTYLLFTLIPKIAVFKKNFTKFKNEYFYLEATIIIFFILIHFGILAQIFYNFNFNFLIIPLMSMLFFMIGHLMPKFKRNFFVGIRTPWTIANDRVWEKTHMLGGKLFKICAGIFLLGLFFSKLLIFIIIPIVIILITILFIYSYLEFKKEQKINSFNNL